jgi:hypothetical protein
VPAKSEEDGGEGAGKGRVWRQEVTRAAMEETFARGPRVAERRLGQHQSDAERKGSLFRTQRLTESRYWRTTSRFLARVSSA